MAKPAQIPEKVKEDKVFGDTYKHPAYGVIRLSNPHGTSRTLFGSDIGHTSTITISIHTADLRRSLSQDRIHGDKMLVEVEMSHAQFAEFITSMGKGDGVPCTLSRYATGPLEEVPAIKKLETTQDVLRREVKGAAKEQIDKVAAAIKRIEDVLNDEKFSKKAIREAVESAKVHLDNLPGNLSFTVGQAEEALEKATSDAKIEVEAFVAAVAQRLGLQSIAELGQLTYDKESK